MKYRFLFFLTFLSGVCGLAHEILYVKIFSLYFGNIFYVSAAILIIFLLSLGLGTLFGKKYVKFLPLIEIGIGLYSIGTLLFFQKYGFDLVAIFENMDISYGFSIALIGVLFFIPSFLIGMSVPIFTEVMHTHGHINISKSFGGAYFFYNLGAAGSVLFLEFILFRNFGLDKTVFFISSINIVIGILLFWYKDYFLNVVLPKSKIFFSQDYIVVGILGILSGIFQIFFLKISHMIFGPLNENFSIILFCALIGISFATLLVYYFNIQISKYLLVGALGITIMFGGLYPFIFSYAYLQEYMFMLHSSGVWLKIFLISIFSIPFFIFLGLSIPLFIRESSQKNNCNPGGLLAISSFGNAIGFLLFSFLIYGFFPDYFSVMVISFVLLILYFIYTTKNIIKNIAIFSLFLISCSVLVYFWPQNLLASGYKTLNNLERINYINENLTSIQNWKKYSDSVEILHFKDGSKWLSLNGYVSLRFDETQKAFLRESIVGLLGSLYSKETKTALVLGLGSGITGGSVNQVYDSTDIIEINPAMLEAPKYFTDMNFDVLHSPKANISLQDGIVNLVSFHNTYDLIVNTVPSPTYYSASKLWTKDIFEIISTRLTQGGVFVGWFDLNLKEEGIKVMAHTLETSFTDCQYFFLNMGYLTFVCSNDSLELQNRGLDFFGEGLREKYKEYSDNIEIYDLIKNLEIKDIFHHVDLTRSGIHSYNTPYLEYGEAAENYQSTGGEFIRNIIQDAFEHLTNKEKEQKCPSYLTLAANFDFCPNMVVQTESHSHTHDGVTFHTHGTETQKDEKLLYNIDVSESKDSISINVGNIGFDEWESEILRSKNDMSYEPLYGAGGDFDKNTSYFIDDTVAMFMNYQSENIYYNINFYELIDGQRTGNVKNLIIFYSFIY